MSRAIEIGSGAIDVALLRLLLVVLAAAIVFAAWRLYRRSRPVARALRWASRGKTTEALALLRAVAAKKPLSAAVHGALGEVCLMDRRLGEAEAELRRAIELECRDPSFLGALAWTLVGLDRLDEALPLAELAYAKSGEDLGVYCLYCGLLARLGRGAEVVELFNFLERTSGRPNRLDPSDGHGLAEKLDFARSGMSAAGFARGANLATRPRVIATDRGASLDPPFPGVTAMSARSELIDAYLEGPALLRRAVADMTADQLRARPVPGKWSTLEVVCHLVDSEQAYCHRMKRVIAETRPLLIGYDETRFAATLGYHDRDLEEELTMLDRMRRQMARVLRSVPESAWSAKGVHSEQGLMTLEDLLRTEAEHVPHHLAHIAEKRKALGLPDVPRE
jgi:tetratricopeptide (TPR) repeat protein